MIVEPQVLAVAAALGGVLALDETALAQTWFSLPVTVGLLTGLALGQPLAGLALGVLCQCVMLGNLPVGVSVALDPVPAIVGVAAASIGAGWAPASLFAADGAARWGWLLAACCLASLVGRLGVLAERKLHLIWMQAGARTLRDGKVARVERLQAQCLLVTAARGALVAVVWAGATALAWLPLFDHLPVGLRAASSLLPVLAPGLAVATVVERFGPRAAGPVVALWSVAVLLAARYFR